MAEHSAHIVPRKTYYWIFAALMVLTFITTESSYFDLGAMNVIVALVIAFTKASLVVLFFMHVKYASRLTQIVVIGGLFWLALLLMLTMGDFITRGWLPFPGK
jgi:cytochrome c oxidase subunit IV